MKTVPDGVDPGAGENVEEVLRHVPDLPGEGGAVHHVHNTPGSICGKGCKQRHL